MDGALSIGMLVALSTDAKFMEPVNDHQPGVISRVEAI